jgi:uncharacterized RDD family membrane protein YckC
MNYKPRLEIHHENELILATIRRRFFAYLIDASILSILYSWIRILFGVSGLKILGRFEVEFEMHNAQPVVIAFLKILFGLLPVIYFTLSFYFLKGQTIGKSLLRLRVISLYHEHIGFWHCVERSLGYYVSTLEGGFGFFQAFWNPNRMALHDKLGETIVIKLQKKQAIIQQDTES